MYRTQVSYLIVMFTCVYLANSTGIVLPPFRQLSNDLQSGKIEIINASSINITRFYYDGECPRTHFWMGNGVPSSNGVLVPDENNSSEPLTLYSGENITIHLPPGFSTFDIGYLAVWCTEYRRNLGHVFMNERYVETKDGYLVLPLQLRPFDSITVRADAVVIIDETTIAISNLHYNQIGNNTHLRVGSGKPSSDAIIVPDERGSTSNLGNYSGENITLHLPTNITLEKIDFLTVWDGDREIELDTVYLNKVLPQEQDIDINGFQLDKFSNESYNLRSGPILLINEKTFYITNLHHNYDKTEFRATLKNGTLVQIPHQPASNTYLGVYRGENFYLTLPKDVTARDIQQFGIWHAEEMYLSNITLNSSVVIPTYKQRPDVTEDGKRILRVQKCCPLHHIVTDNGCEIDAEARFDVEMKIHLANGTHLNDEPMTREWILFAPYINNVDCSKYYLTPELDNYSLLTTGKLLYISAKEQLSLDKYCMDTIMYLPDEARDSGRYLNTVFVCAEGDSGPKTMHIIFAVCAFLSAISLFLTAAIYFVVRRPDDKRGFSIAGYSATMGVAFICLAVTQLAGLEAVCEVVGSLFHFFIVSSFVWFVVITYETLYCVRYFDQDCVVMQYLQRRRIYVGLSIAVPLIFLILAYILDLPAGLLNTHLDAICLFGNNHKWMLYAPIIACIILAVTFAGFCVYFLNKNNSIDQSEQHKRFIWKQQKREVQGRVRFCLFLVTLTALCWLLEIITFSLQFPIFVLDVIHALQGVMVLTTVLSTGGVFRRIVKIFRGNETRAQNGVNGGNNVELTRLNSENYR